MRTEDEREPTGEAPATPPAAHDGGMLHPGAAALSPPAVSTDGRAAGDPAPTAAGDGPGALSGDGGDADTASPSDTDPASDTDTEDESDSEGAGTDTPRLQLDVFEGPLDLLLRLIESRELDITAVSLVAVTEQYMEQLHSREQINLAVLSQFIAVGARLLLLKSRALLPRDPADEDDEDADGADPEALLEALREYRRFRAAAAHLRDLDEVRRSGYRREAPPPELPLPTGLDRVTLDALTAAFRDVLERLPAEPAEPEVVARAPVRLVDRVGRLVHALEGEPRVSFRRMIEGATTRVEVIVDFLAVLELIKARFLTAEQTEAFSDIDLVRIEGARPPAIAELGEEYGL